LFRWIICQKTKESIQIGIDKSLEDGGVIFLKPNSLKLNEKNYKNVC